MKPAILPICALLALSACSLGGNGALTSVPAVAASAADVAGVAGPSAVAGWTTADETALLAMAGSVRVTVLSFTTLIKLKAIDRESPVARSIQARLNFIADTINAAALVRSAQTWREALEKINPVISETEALMGGVN